MQILRSTIAPDILPLEGKTILKRLATRAICIRQDKILLLFTERYQDYSLPGGGVDEGENLIEGMRRELTEETGAQNIRDIQEFGAYEEYRSWYKPEHDVLHMISYCYTCTVDEELGETKYESYEKNNGMRPIWISIDDAIEKNLHTLKHSEKKGLSIEREIFLLERIRSQFF